MKVLHEAPAEHAPESRPWSFKRVVDGYSRINASGAPLRSEGRMFARLVEAAPEQMHLALEAVFRSRELFSGDPSDDADDETISAPGPRPSTIRGRLGSSTRR